MLELSSWFIIGIIYNYFYCYIYSRFNNKEKFKINKTNILICLLISFLYCLVLTFETKEIMVIFKFILTMLLFKIVYNDNLSKLLINSFFIYVIFAIGEMFFAIIFVMLLNIDQTFVQTNFIGIIFANVSILVIVLILINFHFIEKNIVRIIEWYKNKKIVNNIILIFFGLIMMFFFIFYNYLKIESKEIFFINNAFFISVIIFIISFFKEKTDNARLSSEYDQLLDYVKTYEEVIEEKSKNQHEYNNQLILIREMLGNRNKKVREYIDQILSIENEQSKSNWLNKIKNIPNGGLKGLIHYKIVEMQKKKIKLYIDINENVDNKKINKYLTDNLNDISKIIGVYLDNAIEAALKSKEKYIIIEAECNKDKLNFSISNTYKGGINLSKIDNAGYSKKGKNREYGLSLVHDIISKRDDVEQYREFNGIYFVQHICLKYKK